MIKNSAVKNHIFQSKITIVLDKHGCISVKSVSPPSVVSAVSFSAGFSDEPHAVKAETDIAATSITDKNFFINPSIFVSCHAKAGYFLYLILTSYYMTLSSS